MGLRAPKAMVFLQLMISAVRSLLLKTALGSKLCWLFACILFLAAPLANSEVGDVAAK